VTSATMATNDCAVNTEGTLMTDGKLCLSGNGTPANRITGDMIAGKTYIISTTNANTFNGAVASTSIVIEVTSNSYSFNNIYDEHGPVLTLDNAQAHTSQIVESGNSANLSKLALFDCGTNGLCTDAKGYLKTDEKIFTFDTAPAAFTAANIVSSNTCTGNVGRIIDNGFGKYLCLDNSPELKVSITQNGYYAVGTNSVDSGLFTVSKMVKITDELIATNNHFEGKNIYLNGLFLNINLI